MKIKLMVCFFVGLVICGGCSNKYIIPTSTSKPLSTFDTVVIVPVNSDSAFVEEDQYRQLPHDIALATTESFKNKLEGSHLFRKVIISSECTDHAVKIESKIYSLVHHMRLFHLGIRGQIINCQNGKSLYTFDSDDEKDSESYLLANQVAEKLVEGIKAKY